ncbi:MAG: hypothetical protein IJ762_02130 [Bacteroidaceae bacterium]|nr:hypothetical protein [Bacteroidaceae bacterium]MBR1787978.1 hypothetical protein [Bacteroidaceae bacterium]
MQRKDERENRPVRLETKHNQHRRAYNHDYREKGTYMLTMVVDGRKRVFGHIEGKAKGKAGTSEAPHVVLSELGRRVIEQEVHKIQHFYPMVEVWRVAMMPDHIHLLVRVKEALPEGKHLGTIVRGFKTGCTRAWWSLGEPSGETLGTTANGETTGTTASGKATGTTASREATGITASGKATGTTASREATGTTASGKATGTTASREATGTTANGETTGTTAGVPEVSPSGGRASNEAQHPVLFEAGYHDRIINRPGMLENIKRYMAENPLRARIRQECPRLMERQLHLWIGNREYAAFGNLFLLKFPMKQQVFFHRKDSTTGQPTECTEAYRQERARLLRMAEEGTVLVTPGISKGESLVASDALDAQLPLILLQKEPITRYWKPSQRRFYACASGRLLILSPWEMEGTSDYGHFHHLNDLAKELCDATEMRILDYNHLTG